MYLLAAVLISGSVFTSGAAGSYGGICLVMPDTFSGWESALGCSGLVKKLTVGLTDPLFPPPLLEAMVSSTHDVPSSAMVPAQLFVCQPTDMSATSM